MATTNKGDIVTVAFWKDVGERALRAFITSAVAAIPAIHLSNGQFNFNDNILHVILAAGFVSAVTVIKSAVAGNVGNPANASLKVTDARSKFYRKRRSPVASKFLQHWIEQKGLVCAGWKREAHPSTDLTVDHILPKSDFPELEMEWTNFQVLCRSCNSRKWKHIPKVLPPAPSYPSVLS